MDHTQNFKPSSEAERMKMSRVPYASRVGSLLFVMICTGPDIAQAVGAVSRHIANPRREHWNTVKRILRYIKVPQMLHYVLENRILHSKAMSIQIIQVILIRENLLLVMYLHL